MALNYGESELAPAAVVGRSPRELAWRRFRSNKTGVVTLVIALILIFSTIFAPLLRTLFGLDPRARYNDLMDKRGFPTGGFNGISWSHPLGLEPGIGHDLLSRLLFGARISFFVALIVTVHRCCRIDYGNLDGLLPRPSRCHARALYRFSPRFPSLLHDCCAQLADGAAFRGYRAR